MKKVAIEDIKKLRRTSGAGIMVCRKALEKASGDMEKAEEFVKKWKVMEANKKKDRKTVQGVIHAYIHHVGRIGVLIELNCETDFVARTDDFVQLAQEISMQIAGMNPKDVDDLLKQVYIRDSKMKVEDLVKQVIGKLGENIVIKRFERFELGEEE